jgi:hypothetical protein
MGQDNNNGTEQSQSKTPDQTEGPTKATETVTLDTVKSPEIKRAKYAYTAWTVAGPLEVTSPHDTIEKAIEHAAKHVAHVYKDGALAVFLFPEAMVYAKDLLALESGWHLDDDEDDEDDEEEEIPIGPPGGRHVYMGGGKPRVKAKW